MQGSISIENISFSRNFDTKTTSVTDAHISAMFTSKYSNTFAVAHSVHNSLDPIFENEWGSCVRHRSTDLIFIPNS